MALRLKIISGQKDKLGARSVKEFGPAGGSLGRSLECNWVLPDAQRYISSRHASIDFRSGSFYIIDTSMNGVYVNDAEHPVGRGKPQRLFHGDRLRVGDYVMEVEIDDDTLESYADAHHVDPVDLAQRVEAPPPPSGDLVDAFEITGVGIEMQLTDEEMETLKPPSKSGDFEIVIEDGGDMARTRPHVDLRPVSLVRSAPARVAPAERPATDAYPPVEPAESRSAGPKHAFAVHAASPSAAEPARVETPAPPAAYAPPKPATAPSKLSAHAPPAAQARLKARARPRSAVPAQAQSTAPTHTQPTAPAQAQPTGPAQPKPAAPTQAKPAVAQPKPAAPAKAKAAAAPPTEPQSPASLSSLRALEHFCRGAGVRADQIAPEHADALMYCLGQIARETIIGLSESLHLRAEQKNTLRLPSTTIQPQDNNPLKFSAGVEETLLNLLRRDPAQYLTPGEAVREAFNDISLHQQLLLKAVRLALDEFVARLDPDELEQKFARGRGRLMNAANKLKYWDLYKDLYDVVAHHPPGELPMQFLDDFVHAYERELELARESEPGDAPTAQAV